MEILLIMIIGMLLLLLFVKGIGYLLAYIDSANYIKMEIARSENRKELKHWKNELKALRLSFFTFMNISKAREIVKKNTKR